MIVVLLRVAGGLLLLLVGVNLLLPGRYGWRAELQWGRTADAAGFLVAYVFHRAHRRGHGLLVLVLYTTAAATGSAWACFARVSFAFLGT